MKIIDPPGATPLEPEELHELIPRNLRTQKDLNVAEALNIIFADRWLSRQRFRPDEVLTMSFLSELHKKMFSKTWRWAGKFRQSNKNIGCDKAHITEELKKLLDDTLYQIEFKTYPSREMAARFHHRLVNIHPFPNGNGRHARRITDALLTALKEPAFEWGGDFREADKIRGQYINALQCADRNDYQPLFNFLNLL